MKKRLNIQYSIDESEIGNECYRLLSNSLTRLTTIAATSPRSESIMNASTIGEITGLRNELSQIDVMLEDVNAIIDKYEERSNREHAPTDQAPTEKMKIPSFLNANPKDIDLNQLTDFMEQIKNAQPGDFDMSEVANLDSSLGVSTPLDLEPEKIQEIAETARDINPDNAEAEELLKLFSGLQAGGAPNIEDIGRKLKGLKSRIDSSEIPD